LSKTHSTPVSRLYHYHSTTYEHSTMSISDAATNRPNSDDKNTWRLNRDRRRWRKTHTALCLCAEVAATTLTGCTHPIRFGCHTGAEVVSDGNTNGKIVNKASANKAKSKSVFTGAITGYPLDDLVAQLDGGQVQLDCDYGDSAHWPSINHDELTFSANPHLEYPVTK
jgi:hypothetical protein